MIRPARVEDASAIAALWNLTIRETTHTFTTVEKSVADIEGLAVARAGAFWVSQADGGVEGFVTFGPFRAGPGYAHTVEHSVFVTEAVQGKGVAGALLRQVESGARSRGIRVMIGGISGENLRALHFHRKHGYREVARLSQVGFKFGRWLDLVFVQKNLVAAEHSH